MATTKRGSIMVETKEAHAIKTAITTLKAIARQKRTVYGGSDFDPVDYEVLTASPKTILYVIDMLQTALDKEEDND